MGIVITMDCHHGARDLFPEFEEPTTAAKLTRVFPYLSVYMVLTLYGVSRDGQWVKGVGLGKKTAQLGERRVFVCGERVIQSPDQRLDSGSFLFREPTQPIP